MYVVWRRIYVTTSRSGGGGGLRCGAQGWKVTSCAVPARVDTQDESLSQACERGVEVELEEGKVCTIGDPAGEQVNLYW